MTLSATQRAPLALHLAESPEEIELLGRGRGPLRALLELRGEWDAQAFPGGIRPIHYLRQLTGAHRALVIHGNYLDDEETALLGRHAARMAVVYCPRTHAYFAHDPYPLEKMLAAGVCVALGTDSRASTPDLSILAEMRRVLDRHPDVDGQHVLQMGTLNGARALGRDQHFGSLAPGNLADLTIVALPKHDEPDPHRLVLQGQGPVVATWRCGVKRL